MADTETDNVALGFVTSKADAVLLRIESSNTQDYMQMEIVSIEKGFDLKRILIKSSVNIFKRYYAIISSQH